MGFVASTVLLINRKMAILSFLGEAKVRNVTFKGVK